MSKSLGNFYTLRDLMQKGFSGLEVRYLLLGAHYRMQLQFSMDSLIAARHSLERVQACVRRLQDLVEEGRHGEDVASLLTKAGHDFKTALLQDLQIASALSVLFDLIRELHCLIDQHQLGSNQARKALVVLVDWNKVLGLMTFDEEVVPSHLLERLKARDEARRQKDFSKSDQIREELWELGYRIEDTPKGGRLKRR
jgi:cysteinyl-tRNA synthetase